MLDVGGVLAAGGARVVRGHGAPLADLKHRYKVITVNSSAMSRSPGHTWCSGSLGPQAAPRPHRPVRTPPLQLSGIIVCLIQIL